MLIEFTCFFERLQKSYSVSLESEIIEYIYEEYTGKYKNYTLLELINIFYTGRIELSCRWSKKAIIDYIRSEKINIPQKDTSVQSNKWACWSIYNGSVKVNSIYIYELQFEISCGDMIQLLDGNIYYINIEAIDEDFIDVVCVYLTDVKTNNEIWMYGEKFVHMLDYDDVVIIQNIDKCHFDRKYFEAKDMSIV
jgi:hypothetical protein